ncbi:MAG: hypothetical protein HXY21_00780 [Parvularculaceae bacterium]|nr:hypothetical protein [Parvularculaceae bacterium]
MRIIAIAAAMILGCAGCATPPAPVAPETEAVQVMVLGTWHFAGSESDVISAKIDSPLTPQRQRELEEVADALAAFKPTVVVTERVTAAPDYVDPNFAAFAPSDLLNDEDERVQVAYRLAAKAGVARVLGLDEQPSDGEPDYFPFGKLLEHAAATGQADAIGALIGKAQAMVGEETERLAALSMRAALIEANAGKFASPAFYYEILKFDVGEAQPAAELNGYWFMRNAKIFSKLIDVTKPGDRVVLVFGAGHKFWLDHLVDETPGFARVDPIEYLQAR